MPVVKSSVMWYCGIQGRYKMARPEIFIPTPQQADHIEQLTKGPAMIRDAGMMEHLDATELKIAKGYLYGVTRELRSEGIIFRREVGK